MLRSSALSILILFFALQTMQAASAENAIRIKQYSEMYGNQELLISKTGCRIQSGMNYVLISKAPNWNVTVYNPNKNIYSEVPLKGWQGPTGLGMNFVYGARFRFLKETHSQPTTVLNLPAKDITYKSAIIPKDVVKERIQLLPSGGKQVISTNIPLPDQLVTIINKYGRLPEEKGVPLDFVWLSKNGRPHQFLRTISWTTCTCDSQTFAIPSGAKRIKNTADVVVTKDEQGMIEDYFGGTPKK